MPAVTSLKEKKGIELKRRSPRRLLLGKALPVLGGGGEKDGVRSSTTPSDKFEFHPQEPL
jgi:hypothetical protein